MQNNEGQEPAHQQNTQEDEETKESNHPVETVS